MNKQVAKTKWKNHVSNSNKKGVAPLSFDEYVLKIIDAGISPDQIGNAINDYQLGRYSDSGDYTISSFRFITTKQNLEEQGINGGIERMRQKKTGRTKHTDPSIAAQAKKMTGRTKETHPGIAITSIKRAAALSGRSKETHAGLARTSEKLAKPYAFRSPSGLIYKGVNMSSFCTEFGLLANAMSKLKNGHLKSYHGWTNAA